MDYVRITPGILTEDRLDAHYYGREFLDNASKLIASGLPMAPVGSLTDLCNCGATPIDVEYDGKGVGLVRTSDVRPNRFLTDKVLRTSFLSLSSTSKVAGLSGDMLFTMSGTVGYTAVIPHGDQGIYSFSNTIARARFGVKTKQDPWFTAAFFNSSYGYKQSLRLVSGGIQGHVMPNPFKRLSVPTIAESAQRYIGAKVRQADQLRIVAQTGHAAAIAVFDGLTANLPADRKAWSVVGSAVDSYRLNPNHYGMSVSAMIARARTEKTLRTLSDCMIPDGMSGGATPKGAEYPSSGVFFVRVQNVKRFCLDLSDAAYLNPGQDAELVRSRCRTGDVVFSITGYPGTASVVMESDLPVNINQHSVRFTCRPEWPAGYIAAALNSQFGYLQVCRLAIGGTRDALDYPSVRSIEIPEFPLADRQRIHETVMASNKNLRSSQRLIDAAKLLVEALIEGTVTEADLLAAAADPAADRALLARLTRSGLDVAGAAPLFPDTAALASLVADAHAQQGKP